MKSAGLPLEFWSTPSGRIVASPVELVGRGPQAPGDAGGASVVIS
jgi:hypothetical protein